MRKGNRINRAMPTPADMLVGETPEDYARRNTVEVPDAPGGLKFDGGKPRFSLLRFGCARALEGVARVLTFGARKYAAHSWREVDEGIDRYSSAFERHWNEMGKHGLSSRDAESGELHIDHVVTNALFLSELIRKEYNVSE